MSGIYAVAGKASQQAADVQSALPTLSTGTILVPLISAVLVGAGKLISQYLASREHVATHETEIATTKLQLQLSVLQERYDRLEADYKEAKEALKARTP